MVVTDFIAGRRIRTEETREGQYKLVVERVIMLAQEGWLDGHLFDTEEEADEAADSIYQSVCFIYNEYLHLMATKPEQAWPTYEVNLDTWVKGMKLAGFQP